MMMQKGTIFNYWKIIGDEYILKECGSRKIPYWLCECQCNDKTIKYVAEKHLINNTSKSCGCLRKNINKSLHKKTNIYDLTGEYGVGYTTNTNELFLFDLDDYNKIKNYSWAKHHTGYISAYDSESKTSIRLHRLLLDLKNNEGLQIDHINKNKLDNRKSNLRLCNQQENNRNRNKNKNNTSGIIGVSYVNRTNKWHSYIFINKQRIHLGFYDDLIDAIKIRLKAELKYFGDFAPQKNLFKKYNII